MLKKLILPLMLFLIIFTACQNDAESVNEKVVPVKVFQVQPDSISEYVILNGTVTAENDAVIYSKLSEKLDEIYVKVGDRVKADQILAKQYNTALKQGVEIAKAAVNTAQAQLSLAKNDFERIKKLYDQKAVSPQQYDQSKTAYETAQTTLEQAKAQLSQAQESLENSYIKAPFDGVVAAINFDKDQMVPAGQAVAQVVNPNAMKAKLLVSGKDVHLIRKGQDVEITLPSNPNKMYKGKVKRINKALNPVTNSLEIEVGISNHDENVKSGDFGEFKINTLSSNDALIIPEIAVQQQTEVVVNKKTGIQEPVKKYFIFKINDGLAKLTEVQVGLISDGRVEIKDGLNRGDQVVIVGQNIVKDGQKVKIIE